MGYVITGTGQDNRGVQELTGGVKQKPHANKIILYHPTVIGWGYYQRG